MQDKETLHRWEAGRRTMSSTRDTDRAVKLAAIRTELHANGRDADTSSFRSNRAGHYICRPLPMQSDNCKPAQVVKLVDTHA